MHLFPTSPRRLVSAIAMASLALAACAPEIPAGEPPDSVATVQAVAGVRSASLTFTDPAPGTSPITSFEVSISSGPEQTLQESRVVAGLAEGTSYSFRVRACSAAGCGLWSPKSNTVMPLPPISAPSAPAAVTASAGNQSATLAFDASADGGSAITAYEVSVNGGAIASLAANRVVSGLTNGTGYTFQVRACNVVGCGQLSPSSASVTPRTVPSAPSVGASVSGTTINWSWNVPSGNGAPVTGFEVRLDGNLVQTGMGTSFGRGFGYSETHTLNVVAVNAAGAGAAGSASGRTVDAPPPSPSISLSRGAAGPIGGSYWYSVVLNNFPAGSSIAVTCRDSVSPGGFWTSNIAINGAGSGSKSQLCYSADHPNHWVTGGGATSNTVAW